MDRELYLTIKETVLEKMDSSRELSDAELMEQIEEELQKTDKNGLLFFDERKTYAKALFDFFSEVWHITGTY